MYQSRRRRAMKGRGVPEWLKKVGGWFKKNQVVSKALNGIAPMLGPYAGLARGGAGIASSLGYGRKPKTYRKRRVGKITGKGLMLAGSGVGRRMARY